MAQPQQQSGILWMVNLKSIKTGAQISQTPNSSHQVSGTNEFPY